LITVGSRLAVNVVLLVSIWGIVRPAQQRYVIVEVNADTSRGDDTKILTGLHIGYWKSTL